MKNPIAKALAALALAMPVLACCLTASASAADFEAGWGKGLDNRDVEARAILKRAAERICGPEDGDSEKVRKLNRYICENAEYDYGGVCDSLADFVYAGKTVCSGYAEALSYMLDCAAIKNFTVTGFVRSPGSSNMLHIWNVVYIDGKWLHVDPTWNDETRDKAHLDGRYFLLAGEEISAGRQNFLLSTAEEYERRYKLLRTAEISFNVTDGKVLAPVKDTVFALGGYLKQEESGETTIILGTKTLTLPPGSTFLDGAALESLGAKVRCDGDAGTFTLFYDPVHKALLT